MRTQQAPLNIVIAGGGFAGLRVARSLARNGPRTAMDGRAIRVTLVDRNAYFTYTPLLYDVAAAKVKAEHIAPPYHDLLWDNFVAVRQAMITGIDREQRALITSEGPIAYDRLVLAPGSIANPPSPRGMRNGLDRYTMPFMTLSDANAIRERLRTHCLRLVGQPPSAGDLTFVVVGGGPRGVELIFDLANYLERLMPAYGLDRARLRLVLIAGDDRLMEEFTPGFDRAARTAMTARGIRLLTGRYVIGAARDRVLLKGDRYVEAQNVIWAAGFASHPLLRDLGVSLVDHGVPVTATLQLPGHREIYIAGDAARSLDTHGKCLPATGSLAQQHGRFIAHALAADLTGQALPRFRYVERGHAVRFGEHSGYAELGAGRAAIHFRGPAASTFRTVFDLVELPGFAQKRGTANDFFGVPGA